MASLGVGGQGSSRVPSLRQVTPTVFQRLQVSLASCSFLDSNRISLVSLLTMKNLFSVGTIMSLPMTTSNILFICGDGLVMNRCHQSTGEGGGMASLGD